ncbi:hypothetical protein ACOMHN_027127 [Nucella lapillus]
MLRSSPDVSLKEKFKEHYLSRDFTPAPGAESKGGLILAACGIFSLFFECLVVLLPGIYAGGDVDEGGRWVGWFGERWWMMLVLVVFVWMEVTWNWWRVYYDVPNWVTKEMKTALFGPGLETPEGWMHCPTCQLDAPPRSHHCSHCGHCILKRDHHCFFTSSCVGFYNQRHFVVFCCYSLWGCLVGTYLQIAYIGLTLPLPENYSMYIAPVPIIQLFMGNLNLGIFLLLVHVYVNLVFIGTAVTFLIWQIVLILRGQTSHEAWHMKTSCDGGVWKNFTSVFGSPLTAWLLFVAPFMLPMQGDGIKWDMKNPEKNQ